MATTDVGVHMLIVAKSQSTADGRPQSGIMTLLTPIIEELQSAGREAIQLRRGLMDLLIERETRLYNKELEKSGRCLWDDFL